MNEVPTLKDEVERKAIETLERILIEREVGKTTEAQYQYGLDMLWSAVAGLAGNDFALMMEIARQGRRNSSNYTREYLRSPKGDIAKLTNHHDGRVRCELSSANGLRKSEKTYDYSGQNGYYKAARERFLTLSDALVAKGYEEF